MSTDTIPLTSGDVVVVTGSSGHLGEAMVRVLRQRCVQVVSVDVLASPYTDHVGSISDPSVVDRIFADVAERCSDSSQQPTAAGGDGVRPLGARRSRFRGVVHTASLHKPHVATHSEHAFIDVNITGTLRLLETARSTLERLLTTRPTDDVAATSVAGTEAPSDASSFVFIYTSTTSTYGDALSAPLGTPANRITERAVCVPKNIYGVTKRSAEDLCQLYSKRGMPVLVLQAARFFPEEDDEPERAAEFAGGINNQQVVELLHRRVELQDLVDAHVRALELPLRPTVVAKKPDAIFGRFILSCPPPFRTEQDLLEINTGRTGLLAALARCYGDKAERVFAARGWTWPARGLDRVYDSTAATQPFSLSVADVGRGLVVAGLGWHPVFTFERALECASRNEEIRSPLTLSVGSKGYHRKA